MKQINTIDDIFEFYNSFKESNDEYSLNVYGNKIHSNTTLLFIQKNVIFKNKTFFYDKNNCKVILRNRTIERFHPNKINNKEFWTKAKKLYPLLSVCSQKCDNILDCNKKTLNMAYNSGILNYIDDYIKNNGFSEIFEIGYGHGNLFSYLRNNYQNNFNYVGIDYYKNKKLKKNKQFRIIENSGIPNDIKNNSLDIIYSFNVLQHCSKKDRDEYFTQSYSKLKSMGCFIGGMFLETDENKNEYYWGLEDVNGRKYCGFFNQFTEVDKMDEFKTTVNNVGYSIINIKNIHNNYYSFILIKK